MKMRASLRRVGVSIILVGIVTALAVWLVNNSDRFRRKALQGLNHPVVGQGLSRLWLEPLTAQGNPAKLGDLGGKIVVIHFWATWCAPCWQELPNMAALQKKYENRKDVLFLSVSSSEGHTDHASLKAETESVLGRFRVDLPTFSDPHSHTFLGLPESIGKTGYPKTLILDRRGVIRGAWEGYTPGAELDMQQLIEGTLLGDGG
ncbi:MAG: TlpA family protein disulfide reductase [Planctomycetes bacterium]|nr:TlpA family protein disulfide reductase [Planctomycetota bacterium]